MPHLCLRGSTCVPLDPGRAVRKPFESGPFPRRNREDSGGLSAAVMAFDLQRPRVRGRPDSEPAVSCSAPADFVNVQPHGHGRSCGGDKVHRLLRGPPTGSAERIGGFPGPHAAAEGRAACLPHGNPRLHASVSLAGRRRLAKARRPGGQPYQGPARSGRRPRRVQKPRGPPFPVGPARSLAIRRPGGPPLPARAHLGCARGWRRLPGPWMARQPGMSAVKTARSRRSRRRTGRTGRCCARRAAACQTCPASTSRTAVRDG